jgi:hypothetical protein
MLQNAVKLMSHKLARAIKPSSVALLAGLWAWVVHFGVPLAPSVFHGNYIVPERPNILQSL